MILIVVYLAVVAVGGVGAFFLGELLDHFVPAAWSMVMFMSLFFGVLWAAWPVAVYVTEKWVVPGAGEETAGLAKK